MGGRKDPSTAAPNVVFKGVQWAEKEREAPLPAHQPPACPKSGKQSGTAEAVRAMAGAWVREANKKVY